MRPTKYFVPNIPSLDLSFSLLMNLPKIIPPILFHLYNLHKKPITIVVNSHQEPIPPSLS